MTAQNGLSRLAKELKAIPKTIATMQLENLREGSKTSKGGRSNHDSRSGSCVMQTDFAKGIGMRKLFFAMAAMSCVITLSQAKAGQDECKEASARAVQFLKNAHTGKAMIAKDWLTDDARQAPMFSGFGGVEALVKQSTSRAEKFGGLKTVSVKEARPLKPGCEVSAEVKFLKDHKDPANPAVVAGEEMIWTFRMVKKNGAWRIAG
jgi:hypothetical protein